MIVAITGHRPDKLGGYDIPNPTYNHVMRCLDDVLLELRPSRVLTGMALGVDQWMAELCLFNQVPITAAVPFEGFESVWPPASQEKVRNLLTQAAKPPNNVRIICDPGYQAWKLQRRNEWMVEHSDLLVAIFDGTSGGTDNCIRYARTRNKQVRIISPRREEATRTLERPALAPPETRVRSFLRDVAIPRRINRPESEGNRRARELAVEQMREDVNRERREAREREAQQREQAAREASLERQLRDAQERERERERELERRLAAIEVQELINAEVAPRPPARRRRSSGELVGEVEMKETEPESLPDLDGRVIELDL